MSTLKKLQITRKVPKSDRIETKNLFESIKKLCDAEKTLDFKQM